MGIEGSCPWKKSWVEVESEVESDGSGTGWKARGLQDISFTLLWLKKNMEDRDELLREQNGYLHRIASYLDRGEVCSREVPEEDSTKREYK